MYILVLLLFLFYFITAFNIVSNLIEKKRRSLDSVKKLWQHLAKATKNT